MIFISFAFAGFYTYLLFQPPASSIHHHHHRQNFKLNPSILRFQFEAAKTLQKAAAHPFKSFSHQQPIYIVHNIQAWVNSQKHTLNYQQHVLGITFSISVNGKKGKHIQCSLFIAYHHLIIWYTWQLSAVIWGPGQKLLLRWLNIEAHYCWSDFQLVLTLICSWACSRFLSAGPWSGLPGTQLKVVKITKFILLLLYEDDSDGPSVMHSVSK